MADLLHGQSDASRGHRIDVPRHLRVAALHADHVHDAVDALVRLLDSEDAAGRVFNVGSDGEISIYELAQRVIARTGSSSAIRLMPYGEAYAEGFEELGRRKPDTAALRELTGWEPARTVHDAMDDVILYERAALDAEAGGRVGLAR